MSVLTPEGRRIVDEVARRHGVSSDAAVTLLMALVAGQGSQAQFNHPELGGLGQWSRGGMIMVGDMFDHGLKARVDALCNELSGLLGRSGLLASGGARQSQSQSQSSGGEAVSLFVPGTLAGGDWWPAELGRPASVGAQNQLRYAFFPETRRLAIEHGGQVTVYDTRDHRISGFSQQQSGDQSLTFTSQHGLVRVADLDVVPVRPAAPRAPGVETREAGVETPAAPAAGRAEAPGPARAEDDVFAKIERLAELHRKEIITAQEFEAKKAELLSRL